MEIKVNKEVIEDVKRCIESPKFSECVLNNTTEFAAAAFILQILLDAVNDATAKLSE